MIEATKSNKVILNQIHNKWTFPKLNIFVAILLIVVYILDSSPILKLAVAIFSLVVLLFSKAENSFYFLMFIICANELLTIQETSLTMILVALFTVKYFLFMQKSIKASILIWVALFTVSAILAYLAKNTEQIITSIKFFFFMVYIFFVLKETQGKWRILYGNAFRYMAFGINFCGILSLIKNGMPSLGQRYTFSPEITINIIGILCALAIVNLLYEFLFLPCKHKIINIVLIIGCCLWGLFTQSRSFILGAGIGVLAMFLLSPISTKKILLPLCFLGGLGLLLIAEYTELGTVLTTALNRIIDPSNGDISNGRYFIWGKTIESMCSEIHYFLLGIGDYSQIGAIYLDKVEMAHNMFLETWVIYGLIGFLLIFFFFYYFIKNNIIRKTKFKWSIASFIPIFIMICTLFFSHHFIGRSMTFIFVISWLPVVITKEIS